ncbi:ABC transporter ATP-binding protein [Chitinibacter sp. ZOR0017]|uniref:ABC transporter ATP-binding protein n=1 Tax=Chitinibacter sp. ZOR0017 TaxID=1339254 RepID=UPI000647710C|nr:ABC transporter ATP-binding protein [Chitinibacter sp. ZOR0017]
MFQLQKLKIARQGRILLQIDQLNLPPHGLTVILGHNGSGKSTLLKVLAGQLPSDEGQVLLQGRPIATYAPRELAKQIAFMPQQIPQPALMQVRELVELGRFAWRGWLARWQENDKERITAAMQQADVSHLAEHALDEISGGERQRAWLAMLLAQDAQMLLLDEPSSALDLAHQYQLMALLQHLVSTQSCAVVAILHDLNLALRYADRIIALQAGQIWFDGSPAQLLAHPQLDDLYGIELDILARPGKHAVAVVA